VNQDFSDLLRVFNDEKVRYLIVGRDAAFQDSSHRARAVRFLQHRGEVDVLVQAIEKVIEVFS
jgi:hypothetical protein